MASNSNNNDGSSSSTLIDLGGGSGSGGTDGNVETAQWIERLPEAYGIREAVRSSKYRWCVRESAMWGIATGTAMTLHRFRMQSRKQFAVNIGFSSLMLVYVGSYYFCVRRRDYQEKMINLMMQLNTFQHAQEMPEPRPIDQDHPFVTPNKNTNASDDEAPTFVDDDERQAMQQKQYVAKLPERKEWQKQLPTQELSEVFQSSPNDRDKERK